MLFVGVDLAWSENNPTGLATVEYEKDRGKVVSTGTATTDKEIIDYVKKEVGRKNALVTVDAPLLVPNSSGRRIAEEMVGKLFRRYDAGAYPANRKRLSQWTGRVRGEDVVEELEDIGFMHDPYVENQEACRKVIEVYPHPSMVTLFGLDSILKYKNKPGRSYEFLWNEFYKYQRNLENLENSTPSLEIPERITKRDLKGVKGKELKKYEDILDAVFSAYIGLYYWKRPENCEVLGNMEEGYIMTPVKEEMEEELRKLKSQKG